MAIVQDVLQISKEIFDLDGEIADKRDRMAQVQSEIDVLLKTRAKRVTVLEALLVSSTTNLTQPERVLRYLKQNEEKMFSPDYLAEELDININSVRAVLSQLRNEGLIDSPERAYYTFRTKAPLIPPLPPPPRVMESLQNDEADEPMTGDETEVVS